MRIKIKTTNFDLNDEVKEYLGKKLEKIEEIIGKEDPTLIAEVEVGKSSTHHQSGEIFRAEFTITKKGEQFRAEAEKENLFSAIDEVQEEILRISTKTKSKKISVVRRGGRAIKNLIKKIYN